jgi:hypothetical protein
MQALTGVRRLEEVLQEPEMAAALDGEECACGGIGAPRRRWSGMSSHRTTGEPILQLITAPEEQT